MPLPKPSKEESKNDFISRFMDNETMKSEYPDQKQRLAIAYSQLRRAGRKVLRRKKRK